jgi:hypothetical protein
VTVLVASLLMQTVTLNPQLQQLARNMLLFIVVTVIAISVVSRSTVMFLAVMGVIVLD